MLLCTGLIAASLAPLAAAAITAHPGADGVTFKLDGAVLRLQGWSDRIIRVTYAPGDALPEAQSLCVIARAPADPGHAPEPSRNLIFTCLPSQNGLFSDAPQRQSV
jgi:hypothetical protein